LALPCSAGSTCVITNSGADKDVRDKLKSRIDLVLGEVKKTQPDLIFLGLQEYGRHVGVIEKGEGVIKKGLVNSLIS